MEKTEAAFLAFMLLAIGTALAVLPFTEENNHPQCKNEKDSAAEEVSLNPVTRQDRETGGKEVPVEIPTRSTQITFVKHHSVFL